MSFDKESPEMLLLLKIFEKHNVNYLIVGGFAVNRYGYNRTTGDLDIYLKDSIENRRNLIEAIDEMIWVLKNNKIDVYISWIEDIESSFITKIHNYEYLKENNKIYSSSAEILEKLT